MKTKKTKIPHLVSKETISSLLRGDIASVSNNEAETVILSLFPNMIYFPGEMREILQSVVVVLQEKFPRGLSKDDKKKRNFTFPPFSLKSLRRPHEVQKEVEHRLYIERLS